MHRNWTHFEFCWFIGKTVLILSLNSQNCSKIPTELFLNFVCNFWKTLEQLLTPSLKNSNQKKLKTFWILKKPCCSTSKNSSQKFRNFVEILAKKQLISPIGHFLNFAGLFLKDPADFFVKKQCAEFKLSLSLTPGEFTLD